MRFIIALEILIVEKKVKVVTKAETYLNKNID